MTVFCCIIGGVIAQNVKIRVCTFQEIPKNIRNNYLKQAEQSINNFYGTLPFCIENQMIQTEIANTYMVADTACYTPDFMKKAGYPLLPEQYLQEFFKQYIDYKERNLTVEISDITFEDNFYANSMVNCFVIANYQIQVKAEDKKIFSNECRAYCFFPNAANWLSVKLMQIEPKIIGDTGSQIVNKTKEDKNSEVAKDKIYYIGKNRITIKHEKFKKVAYGKMKEYGVCCMTCPRLKIAMNLCQELQKEGFTNTCIVKKDRKTYRVIVDSFSTKDEAMEFSKNFKQQYKEFNYVWILGNNTLF